MGLTENFGLCTGALYYLHIGVIIILTLSILITYISQAFPSYEDTILSSNLPAQSTYLTLDMATSGVIEEDTEIGETTTKQRPGKVQVQILKDQRNSIPTYKHVVVRRVINVHVPHS